MKNFIFLILTLFSLVLTSCGGPLDIDPVDNPKYYKVGSPIFTSDIIKEVMSEIEIPSKYADFIRLNLIKSVPVDSIPNESGLGYTVIEKVYVVHPNDLPKVSKYVDKYLEVIPDGFYYSHNTQYLDSRVYLKGKDPISILTNKGFYLLK